MACSSCGKSRGHLKGCPVGDAGKQKDERKKEAARRLLGGKGRHARGTPARPKVQMIDCNDHYGGQQPGKWHKDHYCKVRVPADSRSHSGSHKCSCGFTW